MEVGVDVEVVRPEAGVDGIAGRFCSPAEQRALAALAPAERTRAAFECWTRKEAYLKGVGAGLSHPLTTVDVGFGPDPRVLGDWSVHQVDLGPKAAAAVAGQRVADWAPPAPGKLEGIAGNGVTSAAPAGH